MMIKPIGTLETLLVQDILTEPPKPIQKEQFKHLIPYSFCCVTKTTPLNLMAMC